MDTDTQKELETYLDGATYALEEARAHIRQLERCLVDIRELLVEKDVIKY